MSTPTERKQDLRNTAVALGVVLALTLGSIAFVWGGAAVVLAMVGCVLTLLILVVVHEYDTIKDSPPGA